MLIMNYELKFIKCILSKCNGKAASKNVLLVFETGFDVVDLFFRSIRKAKLMRVLFISLVSKGTNGSGFN